MQRLITRYGLAAHLAFLAVAPLFLTPVCVLWLSLLGFTWLLMEPSRVGNETVHQARHRVIRRILRDPLFWLLLLVVIAAGLCWMNNGVAMAYDAENSKWFIRQSEYPMLPGSAVGYGAAEFAATLAFAIVVIGCRHAIGKYGRQAFLVLLAIFTGFLGFALSYAYFDGSEVVRKLAEFELTTPVYPGIAFGIGLLVSIVALSSAFEFAWRRVMLVIAIALGGNASALIMFAPLWTDVVFLSLAVLLFIFAFFYDRHVISDHGEFKFLVLVGVGIALAGLVSVAVMTEKPLVEKVENVQLGKIFPEEFMNMRSRIDDISLRTWKESPWLGAGLGSFGLALRFHATEEDWQTVSPTQSGALNGYWHLLVERGLVGAILALGVSLLLFYTYVRRLIKGVRSKLPPPSAWVGLLVLAAVLALTAADCSYSYPGVLLLTASTLAVSARSFPREKSNGR